MKLKNLFNIITLGTALTITAVGCQKKPLGPTPIPSLTKGHPGGENPIQPEQPITNPNGPGNGAVDLKGGNLPPNDPTKHENWVPDATILATQTIYFEYDKSAIKSSEQPKLDQVAEYLKSHPDVAVRVEGNCDERGTEEYNRSLGERRALAAREYLVRLGVDAGRIDTISYGKDRPLSPEHNESGFSKNRRDDFVVLTAPK
jgi:peptidoglycan-associated lipoprotein